MLSQSDRDRQTKTKLRVVTWKKERENTDRQIDRQTCAQTNVYTHTHTHTRTHLRRSYKWVSSWISIIATSEVTIVRCHYCVLLSLLYIFSEQEKRERDVSKEARHSVNRSYLSHCPIHGPHALASTMAPISLNGLSNPSLSMVALICSEPGVTVNWVLYNGNHGNILMVSNHTHTHEQSPTPQRKLYRHVCSSTKFRAWGSSTSTLKRTSALFQPLQNASSTTTQAMFENENFWKCLIYSGRPLKTDFCDFYEWN